MQPLITPLSYNLEQTYYTSPLNYPSLSSTYTEYVTRLKSLQEVMDAYTDDRLKTVVDFEVRLLNLQFLTSYYAILTFGHWKGNLLFVSTPISIAQLRHKSVLSELSVAASLIKHRPLVMVGRNLELGSTL